MATLNFTRLARQCVVQLGAEPRRADPAAQLAWNQTRWLETGTFVLSGRTADQIFVRL